MNTQPIRYIARIVLEAKTPLFIGSGRSSLVKDAIVATDAFGFPYIPGTSLCGVLRHMLEDTSDDASIWNEIFGFSHVENGKGARLRVSSAYLVLNNETPSLENYYTYERVLKRFKYLPVRNHVRIDHRGVAMDKSLFDNEVVYKGCRFVTELEMKGSKNDSVYWKKILEILNLSTFRVGHGTRNGFGRLEVVFCNDYYFDISKEEDFDSYLKYNTTFCPAIPDNLLPQLNENKDKGNVQHGAGGVTQYSMILKSEGFFFFGSGMADKEVDDIPVEEQTVFYNEKNYIQFNDSTQIIFPASSIKGALRHRTCFYYNLIKSRFAEVFAKSPLEKIVVESMNTAVYSLFGLEVGAELNEHDGFLDDIHTILESNRGVVLIDDLFLSTESQNHIFNHVAIDRFTGGPIDGALFSEKATYLVNQNETIEIDVIVLPFESREKDLIIKAFELALIDICRGLLPLGGMTNKGYGFFFGQLWKNGTKIFDYSEAIQDAI